MFTADFHPKQEGSGPSRGACGFLGGDLPCQWAPQSVPLQRLSQVLGIMGVGFGLSQP